MAPADTNVLFVPYRPSSSTSTKSSSSSSSSTSNAPVISQQKHAAREYHRKARLQRLANLDAPHKRHGRSKSEQLAESLQTRPVLPRSQSFSNVEDFDQKLSVFDVGIGEFDPFNACVPHGASNYVLEMLEHGKPPSLAFPPCLEKRRVLVASTLPMNPSLALTIQDAQYLYKLYFRSCDSPVQHCTLSPSLCHTDHRNSSTDLPQSSEPSVESVLLLFDISRGRKHQECHLDLCDALPRGFLYHHICRRHA